MAYCSIANNDKLDREDTRVTLWPKKEELGYIIIEALTQQRSYFFGGSFGRFFLPNQAKRVAVGGGGGGVNTDTGGGGTASRAWRICCPNLASAS